MLGIAIEGNAQIVFMDTPGIFEPRRRLDRAMVASAWGSAQDADIIMLMVDTVKGICDDTKRILKGLEERKAERPKSPAPVLLLNKVDKVDKGRLLEIAAKLSETGLFEDTFMISALNGDGVADVLAYLGERMQIGPWLFPEDQITDMPARLLAAEITPRKTVFQSAPGIALRDHGRDRDLGKLRRWLDQNRTGDLRRTRQPKIHRARQGRLDDQRDRCTIAERTTANLRYQSAPVLVRQSPRFLGRRPGTLQPLGPRLQRIES